MTLKRFKEFVEDIGTTVANVQDIQTEPVIKPKKKLTLFKRGRPS